MGSHPINLTIRFLLEVVALLVMGLWGWRQPVGWLRFLLAPGIPIIVAVAWGTFAVPDDPSRSGAAPIAVPGLLRLTLELVIFVFAIWAVNDLGFRTLSWILAIIVTVHYLSSYDRILWRVRR